MIKTLTHCPLNALFLCFIFQDSEIALVTERKDKEMQDIVGEKNSEMRLALEDSELQRTAALNQLEVSKTELQQKINNLQQV